MAKPQSYKGREDDEARGDAVEAEIDRRRVQRTAEKRVQDLIEGTKRELGELSVETGSLEAAVDL